MAQQKFSVKDVYSPSDNVRDNVMYARDAELFVSGPAGTGKSRAILEKFFITLSKYPGSRALIFRKIKSTLNNTGLITWERFVLPSHLKIRRHSKLDNYTLPNGSVLDIAGMDDPEKIKSGEWDMAFGQEVTECDEADWDMVSSRLRNGIVPYQMLIGDCNPSHPRHWVKVRATTPHPDSDVLAVDPKAVRTRMVETYHTDNPKYWDPVKKTWTDEGRQYISRLRSLTGVTRLRLYNGLWVAAEGIVYDQWDEKVHLVPESWHAPYDWPRLWSIDFGFTAPFVWQEWVMAPEATAGPNGISFPKGSIILYREIYLSHGLVEDHAAMINRIGFRMPLSIVADHDAEDRATLERHLRINTAPAYKDIVTGVQAVKERIRHDIRTPTLYIREGALVHEPDKFMIEGKKPTSTQDEMLGYVWNPEATSGSKTITTAVGLKKMELPLQVNDHGCDATRYRVAANDIVGISMGIY